MTLPFLPAQHIQSMFVKIESLVPPNGKMCEFIIYVCQPWIEHYIITVQCHSIPRKTGGGGGGGGGGMGVGGIQLFPNTWSPKHLILSSLEVLAFFENIGGGGHGQWRNWVFILGCGQRGVCGRSSSGGGGGEQEDGIAMKGAQSKIKWWGGGGGHCNGWWTTGLVLHLRGWKMAKRWPTVLQE